MKCMKTMLSNKQRKLLYMSFVYRASEKLHPIFTLLALLFDIAEM